MGLRVAVAGASGYAGGELLRLVSGHPDLQLATATAHGSAGAVLGSVHPHLVPYADRVLEPTSPELLADADLVFLALPHGASAALAARLPRSVRVVDLGADHRLVDPVDWAAAYGGPHAGHWAYGLPELPGARETLRGASRVAGPGCHATAAALGMAPLLAAELIQPADVVVVSVTGVSGAGRAGSAQLLGAELMGDLSAYKVGRHQHVPEIKQATTATGVSFVPVLAPLPRGICCTVAALPNGAATASDVRETLRQAYADEPFVSLLPEGSWPHTAATSGSNAAHVQGTVDADTGRVLVCVALDNLGKGASGQAVQCANLMLGLPETAGLSALGVAP